MYVISNITAGTISQIQLVLDQPDILPKIMHLAMVPPIILSSEDSQLRSLSSPAAARDDSHLFMADLDNEVRAEASWVIVNAASCGSDDQIEFLVNAGAMVVLNELLSEPLMRPFALEVSNQT